MSCRESALHHSFNKPSEFPGILTEKRQKKTKTEKSRPGALLPFCRGHEGRCGKEERLLLVPGISSSELLAFSCLPVLSAPGVLTPTLALYVFLSRAGAGLSTSEVERKSKIGWLQRSSAKRSRISNRLLSLPVSLRASTHSGQVTVFSPRPLTPFSSE